MIEPLFYLFSSVLLGAGLGVVCSRSSVRAALLLVLAFFNAAGLLLMAGAAFLAFVTFIVYVGAIAVLLLFVVMMLDLRREGGEGLSRGTLALGIGAGAVLAGEIASALAGMGAVSREGGVLSGERETMLELGRALFTHYAFPFEMAGVILLIAMVGAVVLALRPQRDAKRQGVAGQMALRADDVLEIRQVKVGEGIE